MNKEIKNLTKELSKKYNKKEKEILLMINFLIYKKYNIEESKRIIVNFFN